MRTEDISIVYYTANSIPEAFMEHTQRQLLAAAGYIPIVSVSHKPMVFGQNIVVNFERSYLNIYRQALIGAKAASTKYIALAEDDVLYYAEHFAQRSAQGVFAYNMSVWSIFTWDATPVFSYKDRRNLSGLICERGLFIEAMEERFVKWPEDSAPIRNWSEPGKYEENLGVTQRHSEKFYTDVPNIVFSHPTALSYGHLGTRKRHGQLKALALPYWGTAEEVAKLYA